jgi:hypothetical protein
MTTVAGLTAARPSSSMRAVPQLLLGVDAIRASQNNLV